MFIKLVKHLFGILGFKIVRSPQTIRLTMEDCLEHLKHLGFYPQTIIDVGVGHGTMPLHRVFPKSTNLWIEPLVEFEPVLKKLSQTYHGDYILAGASRTAGQARIRLCQNTLEGSSLFLERIGESVHSDTFRDIPLITLDSLIESHHLGNNLLLKLDVQGAEIEALEGAHRLLPRCEAILLEVSLFELQKGIPQFDAIIFYMKSHGFVAYDFFDGCHRPIDNALGQINVVFVKENGFFRKSKNWETKLLPSVSILKAEDQDLPIILELQKIAFQSEAEVYGACCVPPLHQSLDDIRVEFSEKLFLKALVQNKIVGTIRGRLEQSTSTIEKLAVHPDYQNQGIGGQLILAFEKSFPQAARFELMTGKNSAKNIHLYEKLGYQIFRTEKKSDLLDFVYLAKVNTSKE